MSDALALMDTPEVKTINKLRVKEFRVDRTTLSATVVLERLYDDGSEADQTTVVVQSSGANGVITPTALVGFLAAIGAPVDGETGSGARRMNYRILRFLNANGYLGGVTLTA